MDLMQNLYSFNKNVNAQIQVLNSFDLVLNQTLLLKAQKATLKSQ